MTEPAVPLSDEEIELRDAKPYDAEAIEHFRACATRRCGHGVRHYVPLTRRTLATFAAKDAEIAELLTENAALDAKLVGVLSMSTCTKCGLRSVPITYPVGGGREPLKLAYRCPSDGCGYLVSPPMSAKIEALEAKLREAERGLKSAVEFAKAYAPRNDVWADAVRNDAIKYPEHAKLRAVHDQAQSLGAFFEWLESDGRQIGTYHAHGGDCNHARGEAPACGMIGRSHTGRYYLPPLYTWDPEGRGERIERILAMYFNIDLEAVRREKDVLVGELRAKVPA